MTDKKSNAYQSLLESLQYAHGFPQISGDLKSKPEDFRVTEVMDHQPSGEGEHYWVDVTKTNLSSDKVGKVLARFADVMNRDVGFAGMKDVNAVTRQWFSVWAPKNQNLDWRKFVHEGIELHSVTKHSRKIRRGAHAGNQFDIVIRNLVGDTSHLSERIAKIRECGVPNYFGSQRFGWNAGNLPKAESMFDGSFKVRDKVLKGILLSAARSFLFNVVVSSRVEANTWLKLHPFEPANLNGGNAIFTSEEETDNNRRLRSLDIHPTAPMWGSGAGEATQSYRVLGDWEANVLANFQALQQGLESRGLQYQRRALRSVPLNLDFRAQEGQLRLSFSLQGGQFATSVLREIVSVNAH